MKQSLLILTASLLFGNIAHSLPKVYSAVSGGSLQRCEEIASAQRTYENIKDATEHARTELASTPHTSPAYAEKAELLKTYEGFLQGELDALKLYQQIPGIVANISVDRDYILPSTKLDDGLIFLVTVSPSIISDKEIVVGKGTAQVHFSLGAYCDFYSHVEGSKSFINDAQKAVDSIFAK